MQVIQNGVGYDLYHGDGPCHGNVATYDPSYQESGKTTRKSPGQGFCYAAEIGIIQLRQCHL
jgi:hypothetical protein